MTADLRVRAVRRGAAVALVGSLTVLFGLWKWVEVSRGDLSCQHPDFDSGPYGHQTFERVPLRFRCEWPPPLPPHPATQTGLAPTVFLVVSVVVAVAAVVVIWRTIKSSPTT